MLEPEHTHDCAECTFLGTVREAQTVLVPDAVADALLKDTPGPHSIADLNRVVGQRPLTVWDLYVCDKGGRQRPSVIARHGSEGHEYKSMPVTYARAGEDPELRRAARFAVALRADTWPDSRQTIA